MPKILSRVVVLSCVCLATWFVTKSLVAQVRGKPASDTGAIVSSTPTVVKTVEAQSEGTRPSSIAQLPPGSTALPDRPVAHFRLASYQQSLDGNQLKVETSVAITDQRDGVSYVWILTVSPNGGGNGGSPGGPPTVKTIYDQQVFDVAANRQGLPTFSDVIELPSGHHFVEVGLYQFRKSEDLSFLGDLQAAYTRCVAGGSGAVDVP